MNKFMTFRANGYQISHVFQIYTLIGQMVYLRCPASAQNTFALILAHDDCSLSLPLFRAEIACIFHPPVFPLNPEL